MSDEQNIPEEEPIDNSQQLTEESSQSQTSNPKLEIVNMEVNKHPHHVTHKKKWTEYLLEFFMLFLAVFLGFVAENNFFLLHQEFSERKKTGRKRGMFCGTCRARGFHDAVLPTDISD